MDKELNLEGALRPGMDILASEIVISLKKRSRYKKNLEIYHPGLVIGHDDLSLLEYELARMEELHAELGRYTYASQEAFTDVRHVPLIIRRQPPPCPIYNFATGLGPETIQFYLKWIETSCPAGSDSDTYGETVTTDVAALLNFFERINLGKYVAECKYKESPERYRKTGGDPVKIERLLSDSKRQAKVIDMAMKTAEQYDFDAAQARHAFEWLIRITLRVETQYIKNRLRLEKSD